MLFKGNNTLSSEKGSMINYCQWRHSRKEIEFVWDSLIQNVFLESTENIKDYWCSFGRNRNPKSRRKTNENEKLFGNVLNY
jgi:hypothetical protein